MGLRPHQGLAFQSALAVPEAVQKDTTLVDITKAGLDAAETVAQTALVAGAWLASRLADTLNIEIIELRTSLRTIVNSGAFNIRVKGIKTRKRSRQLDNSSPL